MKLKQYQSDTLCILRRFLEESRLGGPRNAYEAVTKEPEQASRLGRYGGSYRTLKGLPDVPYVCLRLPTGGGKTLLAAHTVAVARDAWIEKDWPMVLWLVPTNTIRHQTVEALKNRYHPYRRALDDAFGGCVCIFDIADFTLIRTQHIREKCCIVVGTIQTLRVNNTEGRKVYAHNENLEPHFSRLTEPQTGLEMLENGNPKFSFANLLHLQRPLMVVDEAHNAVTQLTREMQERVRPCAIIEFTATPRLNSNILHSVTASELKREEMIKLPVMLSEYDSWQNAVNGAIAIRSALAKTAADEPDYLRPIVLFQAQKKNQEVTVAVLKQHLIEVERISEERIAIVTGNQHELDGIDLFDPACRIECVITVEALKEGWDCSFAYAFCSVSRIQNTTDVEQLLGRVLRMPYAKRRKADSLNKAYAFLSEPTFGEAARGLVDKLVAMGFDEEEARDNVEPMQVEFDRDLFAEYRKSKPTFKHTTQVLPELLSELGKHEGITARVTEDGKVEISLVGHFKAELEESIAELLPAADRKKFTAAVQGYRIETHDLLSPAECGEIFEVPRLMSELQGTMEFADIDVFMENHDWSILDHSWKLDKDEFEIRETARSFQIDLNGNRIAYQFASEEGQLSFDENVRGWTLEALILWLDRNVRQPDIRQKDLLGWLSGLVCHLTTSRGMNMSALMRCKFILARKVREKISEIRQIERERIYQRCLFSPEAKAEVTFDHTFIFKDNMYQNHLLYRGHWKPHKHFLGPNRVPAFDGLEDGEETLCAQVIDSLPNIKFWIRNVARHPSSFWLPTATGRFYPDFLAMMEDGRLLVVEYKGAHIAESSGTAEKRAIGELWERKSNGKGVFVLAEKLVEGVATRSQILAKIGYEQTVGD